MSLNVLVVDDSDVIRSMILKTLRIAQVPLAESFEASNGREALSVLGDTWIDVVIADINMPVMDGVEMLRRIRADQDTARVPVIVVTTEGSTARVTELAEAGVSAYVRKPFTPEKLRDVILEVTDSIDTNAPDITPMLAQVFPNVLSRFVLMDGEPAQATGPAPFDEDEPLLEARMSFRGPTCGSMTIAAPTRVCVEMAANAMGIDASSQRARDTAADALGEILNMTCGTLVLEMEPDLPTDLHPPTVVRIEPSDWESLAAAASTLSFSVEGEPVLVSCTVRGRS